MLHPLALFPNLLSYPLLAYLVLRLLVVWVVLRAGRVQWQKKHIQFAGLEFVVGFMILLGLYTQGALLAVIALLGFEYIMDKKVENQSEKIILALACVVALALLFLGPGSFALDYPL